MEWEVDLLRRNSPHWFRARRGGAVMLTASTMWAVDAHAITLETGGPYEVDAEGSIVLDGSRTYPTFECILSQFIVPNAPAYGTEFRWDLDDDGIFEIDWSTTPTVTYAATGVDGDEDVRVTMEARCWSYVNGFGWYPDEDDESFDVEVRNVPPVADAITILGGLAPDAIPEGTEASFELSFTDVEPADTHTFSWLWSDGAITRGNPTTRSFVSGFIDVVVTVEDDDGGEDSTSASYEIAYVGPEIVSLSVPSNTSEGSEVQFSAVVEPDPGDLTYTWQVSDGTELSGSTVAWTAHGDGDFDVTLTVSDGVTSVQATRTIAVANVPPTILGIIRPDDIVEGQDFVLSVQASDPGNDILTVEWEIPDAVAVDAGGTQAWQFPDDGVFPVTVTVTDAQGAVAIVSENASVDNVPPQLVDIQVPATAVEGELVSFSAVFEDVAADPLTYDWSFGDGTVLAGPSVARTFPNGETTVELTVADGDGGEWRGSWALTVGDLPPSVLELNVPSVLAESEPGVFSVVAEDAGGDPLSVTWTFGDGATGEGTEISHTYVDDGEFVGSVTLDDGTSTPVVVPFSVDVQNVAPDLNVLYASSGQEGQPLTFVAIATDPSPTDTASITWMVGGQEVGEGNQLVYTFPDDGAYLVNVMASDGEGGTTLSEQVIDILNVAPTGTLEGDVDDSAGPVLSWTLEIVDPGEDTFRVDWDFGDGDVLNDGGTTAQHRYESNGVRTVVATITDDDGGVGQASLDVVIDRIGPQVLSFSVPDQTSEGIAVSATCEGLDAGQTGGLSTTWSFGDGATSLGTSVVHTWADDGEYEVVCTIEDAAGRSVERTMLLSVDNAAPEIVGTPPPQAVEGSTYSFEPTVSDAGVLDTHTWSAELPAGAVLDTVSGALSWSAPIGDIGTFGFLLEVVDDDGGTASLEWSVAVVALDNDQDGISDYWEDEQGLDPTDPTDALGDLDGDGRTNLEEYLGGTDPGVDDRPGAPLLVAPAADSETDTARPAFVVAPAIGGDDELLTYDVQVFLDESGTQLLDEVVGLSGRDGVVTSFDDPLTENETYWWTARASDDYGTGPWATLQSFTVNAISEPPPTPVPSWPSDGTSVDLIDPTLEALGVEDPDGDLVTYDYEIRSLGGAVLRATSGADAEDGLVTWQVDPPLSNGLEVCWTVTAVDEEGLSSAASEPWCFLVDLDNQAPEPSVFVSPADEATWPSRDIVIVVEAGQDPERRSTWQRLELDSDPLFFSDDLRTAYIPSSPSGPTEWEVSDLMEDTWYYARALTSDGSAESAWTETRFFVNEDNLAPDKPALIRPLDGSELADWPPLVVAPTSDPEGREVEVEIEVYASDASLAEAGRVSVTSGSVEVTWTPESLSRGEFTWRARVLDADGGASEWSDEWTLSVIDFEDLPNSRDVPVVSTDPEVLTGCSCAHPSLGGLTNWWWLALGWVGMRRRRR